MNTLNSQRRARRRVRDTQSVSDEDKNPTGNSNERRNAAAWQVTNLPIDSLTPSSHRSRTHPNAALAFVAHVQEAIDRG